MRGYQADPLMAKTLVEMPIHTKLWMQSFPPKKIVIENIFLKWAEIECYDRRTCIYMGVLVCLWWSDALRRL